MSDVLGGMEDSKCQTGQKISGGEEARHGTKLKASTLYSGGPESSLLAHIVQLRVQAILTFEEVWDVFKLWYVVLPVCKKEFVVPKYFYCL